MLGADFEKRNADTLTRLLREKSPPNLAESIRYSLLAPGKRIRPKLLLAAAKLLGLREEAAVPAAVALEMFHCFTLIHDDLPCLDDDDMRRGRPSNHIQFGEGLALLAGDALQSLAVSAFLECAPFVEKENFVRALSRFMDCSGPSGVIGGQASESLLTEHSGLPEVLSMLSMKTGALFLAAFWVPLALAGITPDSSQSLTLEHFGKELGLAFQISDDLDDAVEPPEPHSILAHLSPKDARALALQRLTKAEESLVGTWGAAAEHLLKISSPVREKLARGP